MPRLPLDPVVLSMLDIRPHLENVLKYIHALGRHDHLPPSTLTFHNLCNEDRRAELVTYVIGFAGECALEKLDNLDPGGFDPDDFDNTVSRTEVRYAVAQRADGGPAYHVRIVDQTALD